MKMTMTKPCELCPFRTDLQSGPYLRRARAQGIADALVRGTFACHETTGVKGDSPEGGEQHCAGALIMLEHAEQPSQLMRIFERVGAYDRTKLDMSAPVFTDPGEWVAANED